MADLSDKDRSDLVAYLDGELPDEEARSVEARLNLDAKARAEAEALRKTWELLDYLPRPEPSANFTNRTMQRLSGRLTAAQVSGGKPRWPGWAAGLGWVAAVLLAAGGGFAGMSYLTRPQTPPKPQTRGEKENRDPLAGNSEKVVEEQMVRNLRILENKRLYENVDDIAFIRALDDSGLFDEDEE